METPVGPMGTYGDVETPMGHGDPDEIHGDIWGPQWDMGDPKGTHGDIWGRGDPNGTWGTPVGSMGL